MNRKAVYVALSLLALAAICCGRQQPTATVAAIQAPTAVPTLAPVPSTAPHQPTSPPTSAPSLTPPASVNEPPPPLSVERPTSPTDALSATLSLHTEPGVDVFVTSQKGTLQVGAAIPGADYSFSVELEPDTANHFIVAVRRTYEPYAGAQKNYDLLGNPLVVVQGNPPATPTPAPVWTPAPQPQPNTPPPANPPPVSDDLIALVDYLLALQPSLEQALTIAQRDGEIAQASDQAKDDALLCDGRLAADAGEMAAVVEEMRALSPPAEAAEIHRLLLESGTAWAEALGQVEQFCRTGNQLYKLPALLKFWEAILKFQDAYNRFWALVVAMGLEEWVQR